MAKLFGLVTAAAVATAAGVVFLWRRNQKASKWTTAKDSAVSWSKTAAQGAGKAAEKVAGRS
jgi:hypothetical protein